jgi:GNAT superfamily N-acetyltransferase
MRTTHRDYAEEAGDFRRLARLLTDDPDHVRGHTTWCLGRLTDWKHGLWGAKPSIPRFCERNAHLWFDGLGDLVAAAISEEGGPQAVVLTTRGHRFLFEEVLAWAVTSWGERGPLSVEVTEAAQVEVAALERCGFRPASTFHAYTFDLTRPLPPPPPLPPGFAIVDMASNPDYAGRRRLRADAFEGRTDLTEAELARDLELDAAARESPIYHPATDVVVRSDDGRLVAGCEALIDARNAAADIERICTHSAYRRRGLARAAIHDCLRRLREMGMVRAHIAGYSREALALYGSLGAVESRTCLVYRQEG